VRYVILYENISHIIFRIVVRFNRAYFSNRDYATEITRDNDTRHYRYFDFRFRKSKFFENGDSITFISYVF